MNKKTFLFVVGALTAGILVGHVVRPCERQFVGREIGETVKQAGAVPRFDGKSSGDADAKSVVKTPAVDKGADMDRMIGRYVRMKGDELLAELKKLEDGMQNRDVRSNHALYIVLSRYLYLKLGQASPRQALLKIKGMDSEAQAKHLILTGWREKNPDAALAYCAEQLESGGSNMQISLTQASLMAAMDPEKALSQALTTPSMEQNLIIRQALAQIIEKNPQSVAETIKKSQEVFLKNEWAYQGIAGDWARADWDSAIQWINTLPEDKKKKAMASAVASLPLEQASLHLADLDGKEREAAIYQITGELAYDSPKKALEWLMANATEDVAVQAVGRMGFSRNFLSSEVSRYVDQLPAGKIKDIILEQMISEMKIPTKENEFWDIGEKDIIDKASQISSQEKRDEIINGQKKQPLRFGNREMSKGSLL